MVEKIRETVLASVHFGTVGPAPRRPSVLLVEGPAVFRGIVERAVIGHERALRRAGFRTVEGIGVDPDDARGRQGRLRADIPEPGIPWRWERLSGEALQNRIIDASEVNPGPRLAPAPTLAKVVPLRAARRR